MLSDPLAVAARSPTPAVNFKMIKQDGYGSERRDVNGLYSSVINHSTGKTGARHYLQVRQTKDVTNPYTGVVSQQIATVSVSFAQPPYGFTAAEMAALWLLAFDTMAAATPAAILNFES